MFNVTHNDGFLGCSEKKSSALHVKWMMWRLWRKHLAFLSSGLQDRSGTISLVDCPWFFFFRHGILILLCLQVTVIALKLELIWLLLIKMYCLTCSRVPVNLRLLVYRYGMKMDNTEKSWNIMYERYQSTSLAQEKDKLLYGLASVENVTLLNR